MTLRILAIDDSRTIRELLRQTMTRAGFHITTAVDGIDGCAVFGDLDTDVVITDINMPRMDGFGVIETIRGGQKNALVPILVLTTERGDVLKSRARQAGATGWVVKPFDDAALISALKRVTGF